MIQTSKYTTEVRFICESLVNNGDVGFNDVNAIIYNSAPLIFNFEYPIYDENYRLPLECKILRHYYTREISEETLGLWKLRLQDKLNLVMPYYNEMYKSALLEFNPLYDVDITRTHTTTGGENQTNQRTQNDTTTSTNNTTQSEIQTGNVTAEGNHSVVTDSDIKKSTEDETSETGTATAWNLYSDTPQGSIDNVDLSNNAYLTNATKDTNTTTTTGERDLSEETKSTTEETKTDHETQAESRNTNATTENTGTSTRNNTDNTTIAITTTQEYIEHVAGKQGSASYSQLIKEFRETIIRIDELLIDELSTLFFGLW